MLLANTVRNSDLPAPECAARAAHDRLRAQQNPNGTWEGEVVWCPVITAQIVFLHAIMGRPLAPDRQTAILHHFAHTRRPDGGWGLHPESHSYLFVTTLVYVAGRILGEAPDSALLAPALRWLRAHPDGLRGLPTWGRFWLSLVGLFDRRHLTACPPEFFLLPDRFPLAPNRLYCHTRYIYLGMAFLGARGVVGDLGALRAALRDELPGLADAQQRAARHRLAATDAYVRPGRGLRLIYDLMAALGPFWLNRPHGRWLRRRAMARCLRRIRAEQEGAAFRGLSPVSSVLNTLALWSESPEAPDVAASLAGLDHWVWQDAADGLRYAGARSTSWDTAFALQALCADPALALQQRESVARGYDALAALQVKAEGAPRDEGRQSAVGGWCFGEPQHGWAVSDCAAEALSALNACHAIPGLIPSDRQIGSDRMAQAVSFILDRQNEDGGFGTYERRRGGPFLERLNPSEMFGQCMTELSYVECTASAVRALAHVRESAAALITPAASNAIERGVAFLLSRQREDGAWPGFWGINFIYATSLAAAALATAGLPQSHPALARAGAWLRSVQRADGGWGEHFSGCLSGSYVPNERSLVISTSWALLGLLHCETGLSEHARQGLAWLCRQQTGNGDFPRDSVNGVFFGTAMLDYRLYNSYFPLWALARAGRSARHA